MSEEIRMDLSRKLQKRLGELLDRETALARAVLSNADVALMMVEAGVMMQRTIAASIAIQANDGKVDELYDSCVQAMANGVAHSRSGSLERIAGELARRSS